MKLNRLPDPAKQSPFTPVIVPYEGNKSGIAPIGTKVLVLPDQVAEKTAGGIFVPESTVERNALAITTGMVVGSGAGAFQDWADPSEAPKPGQRIHMARYSGLLIDGKDGRSYRLIQDIEIAGVEL